MTSSATPVPAASAARLVVTGAAGLVGQNLVLMLREAGWRHIVAIDKHAHNLALLARLNPGVQTLCADLAEPGAWADAATGVFADASAAVVLHAQITGKTAEPFQRNNVEASRRVFDAIAAAAVPYTVLVSSSVVNSVADDDYTRTKRAQEQLFRASGLPGCVLRPTLMFGWFDPKHFGWLARFMERMPLFPVPGHGRYMRQPLYERDFCRVIQWCLAHRPGAAGHASDTDEGPAVFDLVGHERIDYIDIIRAIRSAKGLRTPIVKLPVPLFKLLLRAYALFSRQPPFTADQLDALMAGDDFRGVDLRQRFGITPTPFAQAIGETFGDARYASLVVERV